MSATNIRIEVDTDLESDEVIRLRSSLDFVRLAMTIHIRSEKITFQFNTGCVEIHDLDSTRWIRDTLTDLMRHADWLLCKTGTALERAVALEKLIASCE